MLMISYGQLLIFGAVILICYIAYKKETQKKPSEFYLLRNHLQKITHPSLNIKGFGNFYICYEEGGQSTVEYFNSAGAQRRRIEEIKSISNISNLRVGYMLYKEWKNWK